MRKRLVFACLVLLLVWPASVWAAAELSFAGYQWQVKDGYDYPGKNHWSSRQAWVDEAGALHLRLEKRGLWYCAEVISREYFSYGRFSFQVIGELDRLDPQVVLGLFLYHPASLEEADVEVARWGRPQNPNGLFGLYRQERHDAQPFRFVLPEGTYSTYQIEWLPEQLRFVGQYGHRSDEEAVFARWQYPKKPVLGDLLFERRHLQVRMNLWLYGGRQPQNGKDVEVVIHDFQYRPWS